MALQSIMYGSGPAITELSIFFKKQKRQGLPASLVCIALHRELNALLHHYLTSIGFASDSYLFVYSVEERVKTKYVGRYGGPQLPW